MCNWYKRSYATGRYELEVAASAALVHCSRAPAELSSSALVPPRCSLSLYYPVITLVHLPLELRSRAGAYSSNHRLLTRTSAHTYYMQFVDVYGGLRDPLAEGVHTD
jgi:hypothetical protein